MKDDVDSQIGFSRKEMFTTSLLGDVKVPDIHLFVAFGDHISWPGRIDSSFGSPPNEFKTLLSRSDVAKARKLKKITLTAIEPLSGVDEDGDVIIFPHRLRIRKGSSQMVSIVEAICKDVNESVVNLSKSNLRNIESCFSLGSESHIFVCAHGQRDARCGHCGPLMIEKYRKESTERGANVCVRACSHIGGHKYAGNAIVYRSSVSSPCDWLGYLSNSDQDAQYVIDLATGSRDFPRASTWRGREGLSTRDLENTCFGCMNGDISDIEDLKLMRRASVVFVVGSSNSEKVLNLQQIAEKFGMRHIDLKSMAVGSAVDTVSANESIPGNDNDKEYGKRRAQFVLHSIESSNDKQFLIEGFPENCSDISEWKKCVRDRILVRGVVSFRSLEGEVCVTGNENQELVPFLSSYSQQDKLFEIDSQGVNEIEESISQILEEKLQYKIITPTRPSVLFVLGGPGSGKGTQCDKITEIFPQFKHLSAGELLRIEHKCSSSEISKLIDDCFNQGKIVPAEVTIGLLLQAMRKSPSSNFLIDGFPRNEDNLSGWNRIVGNEARLLGCLFFDCSEETMKSRLVERGESSGRVDDKREVIERRLAGHIRDTIPIVYHFKSQNLCYSIDGNKSREAVFNEVVNVLQDRLKFESKRKEGRTQLPLRFSPVKQIAVFSTVALLAYVGYSAFKRRK